MYVNIHTSVCVCLSVAHLQAAHAERSARASRRAQRGHGGTGGSWARRRSARRTPFARGARGLVVCLV